MTEQGDAKPNVAFLVATLQESDLKEGFPGGSVAKSLSGNIGDADFISRLGRSSGKGNGKPTPAFLPRKSLGQRSLERGRKESDTTEHTNI